MRANESGIEGRPRRASASRPFVLWMVLLAAAFILVGRWAIGHNTPPRTPYSGDGEEAGAALDSALAPMPETSRLPFLLRSVKDPRFGLRYAAVDALGRYGTREAADAIESAFRDSASIVRQRAVETLHVVDHERGTMLLLAALRDEDSWIRESAATQLAMREQTPGLESSPNALKPHVTAVSAKPSPRYVTPIADRRAVPMLIRALDDEDDVVSRSAVGLLHHLTGRGTVYHSSEGPAGKRRCIEEWKAWWRANGQRYPVPAAFVDVPPIRPSRSDPAPDFDVRDVSGRPISLASQRGRVTLINFWGTWCAPCRFEMPNLQRIHDAYGPRGLTVLGAAVSETNGPAELRTWCARHGFTYRQALATTELQEAFGDIHEVPVSVLIDKRGQLRYRWDGERDYATFRAAVERLLAE
jgi:peroxiredoxin